MDYLGESSIYLASSLKDFPSHCCVDNNFTRYNFNENFPLKIELGKCRAPGAG